MIQKTVAARHNRTYIKPDAETKKCEKSMADLCAQATYEVRGVEHNLQYDGKVDDLVLNGMKPERRDAAITDIKDLAPHLSKVEAQRDVMNAGESVELELSEGSQWSGKLKQAGGRYGDTYEFKSGNQSVVFSTLDSPDDISSVQLRSRGDGVTQDISALAFNSNTEQPKVYYFAEGVNVFARKKK